MCPSRCTSAQKKIRFFSFEIRLPLLMKRWLPGKPNVAGGQCDYQQLLYTYERWPSSVQLQVTVTVAVPVTRSILSRALKVSPCVCEERTTQSWLRFTVITKAPSLCLLFAHTDIVRERRLRLQLPSKPTRAFSCTAEEQFATVNGYLRSAVRS